MATAPGTSKQSPPARSQAKETEFRIENAPYEKRVPSCAECRRLKRRCDRKWPCQSCIARGCASICPNGSLTTEGGGSRSILRKIKEMSKRIGQLEDALSALWTAKEEHPLLRPDLLKVKSLPDTQNPDEGDDITEVQVKDEADGDTLTSELETLTLGSHGKMNYMGRTAKFEFILQAEELDPSRTPPSSSPSPNSQDAPASTTPSLPQSITDLAHSFLLTPPINTSVTLATLLEYLPPSSRAIALCDCFYTNAGWFYSPMPKSEFVEDVLSLFYKTPQNTIQLDAEALEPIPTHGAHDLALLFMVLAVGTLLDVSHSSILEEVEMYQTLARAALSLEPLANGCSLALVQTLNVMIYKSQWDHYDAKAEGMWAIMGLASKMALTLGLHRDCARWNLPQKEINRRRYVFWELFSSNAWASLGSGRPPSLQLSYTDCQLPNDPSEKTAQSGKVTQRSFANYKHHYTRDCLWPIIEQNFNLTKSFNYASVLALDRKVREFDFGNLERESISNPTVGLILQRYVNRNCKDHVILHMHRVFFARALATHPDSPLDSPYTSSVLATFKCAVSLLQDVNKIYQQAPFRVIPIGLTWSYTLTSAMAMGNLCTKGPRGRLAPVAFEHLKVALNIAETKFGQSPRAASALPMLQNLMFAAQKAIAAVGPGPTSAPSPPQPPPAPELPQHSEPHTYMEQNPPSTRESPPVRHIPDHVPPNHGNSSWLPPPQTSYDQYPPPESSQSASHYDPMIPMAIHSRSVDSQHYVTPTLLHHPTYSHREPGMPIRPDDYIWLDEPERPMKRFRVEVDSSGADINVSPISSAPHPGHEPTWQGHAPLTSHEHPQFYMGINSGNPWSYNPALSQGTNYAVTPVEDVSLQSGLGNTDNPYIRNQNNWSTLYVPHPHRPD